jgi:REP element-mobilizing transposase RayT
MVGSIQYQKTLKPNSVAIHTQYDHARRYGVGEDVISESFSCKMSGVCESSKPFIHGRCSFCQDLSFQEKVLCDLNRSIQNPTFFECHAFQPLLKLVASSGQETGPEPKVQSAEITLEKLLDSDKIKYQRALALQKLARNPDDVMLDIKYHFAWNVIERRPAFAEPAPTIDFISNAITICSVAVGGVTGLLWLAPDHIHLYVESDGEVSLDNMAQRLKRLSEAQILERFPDLIAAPEVETGLWDEAYFVETIG